MNTTRHRLQNDKDYKVTIIRCPTDNTVFVHVYHYYSGFSANFKSISDAEKCLYGSNIRYY